MTNAPPPTDQGLEVQVFGRQAQAEDWLRDIRLRTSLLFLPLPEKDLNKILRTRLMRRSSWSIPHLERIIKTLENRTEAFLGETRRLREAVEGSALPDASSGSMLTEAYLDDIEWEARAIQTERQRLMAEWNGMRGPMDPRCSDHVTQAQRLLEQAAQERGVDRTNLLRDARNAVNEIANIQTVVPPIVHLLLGWTTWQLTENWLEAGPILARVSQYAVPTMGAYHAYRLLSYFSELDEQPLKALEWSRRALEIHNDPETFTDAALAAAALHDPSAAKSYFENALVLRAGSLIGALSDDRVLHAGTEILEVAIRVQLRLRREGRHAVASWAASAREVSEAQRLCGNVHMPFELMEGHKGAQDRLDAADLISGGYLTRNSRDNAIEVLEHAKRQFQAEHIKRADAVGLAKRSIENAEAVRNQRVKAALLRQEEVNDRARAALRTAEGEAEKAEKGSIFGFGSGCGMFALYVVSYLVLADRGIAIGVTTPVGFMATLVSAIPIVMAVGVQVRDVLKRMALEAQAKEIMRRAAITYDEASKDADDAYREQMKKSRKALATADGELRKVDSAMRYLGLYHPHAEEPAPIEVEPCEEPEAEAA